jgi:DNA mismatch repair protein MutL
MLFLYVNGRAVRDQLLRIAILEAYRTLLPKGQFPLGALLLELPAQQVDVNVHPTKAEVRFQNPRGLAKTVTGAVRTALSTMESQRWARPLAEKGWQRVVGIPIHKELKQVPLEKMTVAEPRDSSYERKDFLSAEFPVEKDLEEERIEEARGIFGELNVIGQLHHSYILCEAGDGLILIDQHAAHERVFFEIFRRETFGGEIASQILIVPETIEVTAEEAAWLQHFLPLFSRLGFGLEPFGTNTFVIRAVPAVALRQEPQRLLLELVASGCEGGRSLGAEALLEKLLQSMACRIAIKAGQKMGKDEMAALLQQLDGLDLSSTCPHGRPLWWKITLDELERMFGRA